MKRAKRKLTLKTPMVSSNYRTNVRNGRKFTGRDVRRKKKNSKDSIPILYGSFHRPGQVKVYCPNCNDYHLHGWPKGTPLDSFEHRAAHCHDPHRRGGPYERTGYYIALSEQARKAA